MNLKPEQKKILDDCWRKAVKERDMFIDQWDLALLNQETPGTDAHHIFGRGTSIINRYDVGNGITLSRKNHGLAEDSKMLEFENFIKEKLKSKYDKFQKQKNIQGIPFEYEAMFFNNFFETKKQELEDYYKINGFELISKLKLIEAIEKVERIHYINKNDMLKLRCIEFCKNLNPRAVDSDFSCSISNKKIQFYYSENNNRDSFYLFELFLYELLKGELEYVYRLFCS